MAGRTDCRELPGSFSNKVSTFRIRKTLKGPTLKKKQIETCVLGKIAKSTQHTQTQHDWIGFTQQDLSSLAFHTLYTSLYIPTTTT